MTDPSDMRESCPSPKRDLAWFIENSPESDEILTADDFTPEAVSRASREAHQRRERERDEKMRADVAASERAAMHAAWRVCAREAFYTGLIDADQRLELDDANPY